MKRERHDATVISSSIALLQERFRQLQRVTAMREEKEVSSSKMLAHLSDSQPRHNFMMMHNKRARLLFHPSHHVRRPSASPRVSLSPWSALKKSKHEKEEDYVYRSNIETPLLINLWPGSVTAETPSLDTMSSLNKFEDSDCDSDVDTSLHL